jgi:hypothetical protein
MNFLDRSLAIFGTFLIAGGFLFLFRGDEFPGAALTILGILLPIIGGAMIGLFFKRRAAHP